MRRVFRQDAQRQTIGVAEVFGIVGLEWIVRDGRASARLSLVIAAQARVGVRRAGVPRVGRAPLPFELDGAIGSLGLVVVVDQELDVALLTERIDGSRIR